MRIALHDYWLEIEGAQRGMSKERLPRITDEQLTLAVSTRKIAPLTSVGVRSAFAELLALRAQKK